jgi:uncharacterized protein involved in outer membrane biogenesis
MQDFFRSRPKAKWAGIILIAVAAALVLVLALFDWNLLRPALAKEITAKTGRQTTIAGDLRVHLWSWNPSIEVNEISLKNPSWADRPIMFGARRIGISVSLARLLRGQLVIPEIDLVEPTINLEREADGKASWELGDKVGAPKPASQPAKLPTIRRLIVERGKLHVVDQIRKLTFSGSLVAADQAGRNDSAAFQIRCTGTLNGKPFGLEANGGPLIDLEPDKPYSVSTRLTAADITLESNIKFSKPFDFGSLEVKFVVAGNDLADVYYLTGLALPNTPKYRLAATVQVDGSLIEINDLQGHLGSSDISGKGHVDTAGKIPSLTATLFSKQLNIADLAPTLGEQAPPTDALAAQPQKAASPASSSPQPSPPAPSAGVPPSKGGLLLPDADLQVNRVRGMNADVTYRAAAVAAPKVPMKAVGFHLVLDNGVLTINPLSFALDVGQFSGSVQINARKDVPETAIDMRIEKIDLGQFKSASMTSAPLQGVLQGRFQFHGAGSSLHKFAAASDGTVSVVIPHGQIREAFAQLTGINVLKGLGLLLTKQGGDADIRCGIIDLKDHDGSLNTTTVYVDTSNVLITGRGHINLRDESIDLALQGDPKNVTFVRLRSPISIHGTLENPGVGLKAGKLAEQVGEAVALGAVLTPAAAALAFVDPGLAKDKDCSTVLAQASAGVRE